MKENQVTINDSSGGKQLHQIFIEIESNPEERINMGYIEGIYDMYGDPIQTNAEMIIRNSEGVKIGSGIAEIDFKRL